MRRGKGEGVRDGGASDEGREGGRAKQGLVSGGKRREGEGEEKRGAPAPRDPCPEPRAPHLESREREELNEPCVGVKGRQGAARRAAGRGSKGRRGEGASHRLPHSHSEGYIGREEGRGGG